MGKVNKDWTPKQLKLLKTMRDHGLKLREIALLMGRGIESIKHACIIHEIQCVNVAHQKWKDQYYRDPSVANAAKFFGVSVRKAKYWKHRLLREGYKLVKQRRGRKKKNKLM